MSRILFLLFVCSVPACMHAQRPVNADSINGIYLLQSVVVDGDTIPSVTLRTAYISDQRRARSQRYQRYWSKLHRNVVKTYPYAQLAGELIKEYNRNLALLRTDAEKKAYLDKCEADLKAEFEGELKSMTISQGRVLLKLIDRQTGQTSYALIRDLKNGFSAFMWQGVAKLFGSDLKAEYNPELNETDYMIEEVVAMIESGQIPVRKREAKTTAASEVLKEKDKRLQRKIARELRKNG